MLRYYDFRAAESSLHRPRAMEREHAAHDSTVASRSVGASICLQCSMAFLCNPAELRLRKVQLIKELQMVRLPR